MNTPQDFVNWLEGFLDACKNAPSLPQVKEIRKKISALPKTEDRFKINRVTGEVYSPLWTNGPAPVSSDHFSTISLVPPGSNIPNNGPLDEEFIRAIEENKNASTLEELHS